MKNPQVVEIVELEPVEEAEKRQSTNRLVFPDQPETQRGRAFFGKPPRRRVALKTLDDVRKEMAKNYRLVVTGELAPSEATRRTYLLAELGKMISLTEMERRVQALEELALGQPQEAYQHPLLGPGNANCGD